MRCLFIALLLCLAQAAPAQHTDHRHEPSEKLGRVNFAISCTPAAQKQFNRAVAWLHSFEYEEAEKAFIEVAATDPRCGMARSEERRVGKRVSWGGGRIGKMKK